MTSLCLTGLINQFVSHEHLRLLQRLIVSQVNGSSNFPSSAKGFIVVHICETIHTSAPVAFHIM